MKGKKKKGGCLKWLLIGVGGVFGIGLISTFSTMNEAISGGSNPSEYGESSKKEAIIKPSGQTSDRDAIVKHFQSNAEPIAKDAVWTSKNIFKIGVIDDGTSRDGYAQYVGEVLAEAGYSRIWIHVVDIVKLKKDGKWIKLGEYHME